MLDVVKIHYKKINNQNIQIIKSILEGEIMRKFLILVYICFLFIGAGRILLDVFREEPFNYMNILISALSFFGILSYLNKKSERD